MLRYRQKKPTAPTQVASPPDYRKGTNCHKARSRRKAGGETWGLSPPPPGRLGKAPVVEKRPLQAGMARTSTSVPPESLGPVSTPIPTAISCCPRGPRARRVVPALGRGTSPTTNTNPPSLAAAQPDRFRFSPFFSFSPTMAVLPQTIDRGIRGNGSGEQSGFSNDLNAEVVPPVLVGQLRRPLPPRTRARIALFPRARRTLGGGNSSTPSSCAGPTVPDVPPAVRATFFAPPKHHRAAYTCWLAPNVFYFVFVPHFPNSGSS